MTYKELRVRALANGSDIARRNPGDGVARYRLVPAETQRVTVETLPTPPEFFASNGYGTCMGIQKADAWLDGFAAAKWYADRFPFGSN